MSLTRLFQRSDPLHTFLIGLVLGVILTGSVTLRIRWAAYDKVQSIPPQTRLKPVHVNCESQHGGGGGSGNGNCVCGSDLELLWQQRCSPPPRAPAPVIEASARPSSSAVIKPSEDNFKPLRVLRDVDRSNLTTFLHPSSNGGGSPNNPPPQYLSRVFPMKQKLLVAVLTCQKNLHWASAIYDTWGDDVSQIMFFVGDGCNTSLPEARGLPLVRLPTVPDQPCVSVTKLFSALKYLLDNDYPASFHWFMLVVSETYVRGERLESLLMKLDPSSMVYLGRAGNGREKDQLSLLSSERYCLGRTGVVLSGALVKKLGSHLEYCFSASKSEDSVMVYADVELGRCISRKMHIQCSQCAESKAYFYQNYDGKPVTLQSLQKYSIYKDLISFNPVPSLQAMYLMHYHYKQTQFKSAMEKSEYYSWQVKDLCTRSISGLPPSSQQCEESTNICKCRDQSHCPPAGVVATHPKPYRSSSVYDYMSWDYFDEKMIYNDRAVESSSLIKIKKDIKKELQSMLSKAVQIASEKYGRQLKFKKVVDGWVRHNPVVGSEFIVDCWFTDSFKHLVKKRVAMVRPLATNYIALKDSTDMEVPINFIVPIARVNERLTEFLAMYEELVLKSKEKVNLILSVYGKEDVAFVDKAIAPYKKSYPGTSIKVVEGQGEFSRGKALHLAISKLYAEDLAFFCDVDMTITKHFLNRCRRNAIRGRRVYFPEFFKLYNLDYVYYNRKRPPSISLKRAHGHWAYYSFGMVCIYRSDYDAVGGMNTNIVGWGEEDVNFFQKVVRKNLDVLRSPDTALSHRWHEKHCPDNLAPLQRKHCLSSRGENLADRIDLANYIYARGVQLTNPSAQLQLSLYSNYSDSAEDV